MDSSQEFDQLISYLLRVPSVRVPFGKGRFEDGNWWVKFQLDISHPLAWRVVQELGHVLNYVSLTEQLPTVFKPVSPPVYLNGGPDEHLSWVIDPAVALKTRSVARKALIQLGLG